MLDIKLKELGLALKRQEHEIQLAHLCSVKIEAQQDTKLRSLESLHRRLVPLPCSRVPSSPVFAIAMSQYKTVNFESSNDGQLTYDVAKHIKLVY